ncbi:MAG TPA: LamG domain-containing protein [Pseudonocardiaceae bacterium]|nr:LamG domain-containing protein [Pseudonocardiaceae bacterium]
MTVTVDQTSGQNKKVTIGSLPFVSSAAGSVQTTNIADGNVTGPKLASQAVTSDKIATGGVGSAQIADNSITSSHINAGAVGTGQLAGNAVDNTKLADGAVSTTKLVDGSVTTVKLADGSVATAKVADSAITAAKLDPSAGIVYAPLPAGLTPHRLTRAYNAYAAAVAADGATVYWRLGETSGTTAASDIGSYPGTISGGVTLNQAGAVSGNPAMLFNGSTGKIRVASPAVGLAAAFTIEAWFKVSGQSGQQAIFSNRESGTNGIFFGLGDGQNFVYIDGATPNSLGASGTRYDDGKWHHYVAANNGSTTWVYLDAVLIRTGSQTRSSGSGIASIGWDGPNNAFWPGAIDDVAVYPSVLTQAQIASHYKVATNAGFLIEDAVAATDYVAPGAIDAPSGLTAGPGTLVGRYSGSGPTLYPLQQIALGGKFDMSSGTFDLASSFYATGTWTPTIIGSAGSSGQVYAVQGGRYTKIGNLVVAWFRVKLSALGTLTGSVQIGGLPFTVYNDTNSPWTSALFWDALNTAFVVVQCNPSANSAAATLIGLTAASTSIVSFLGQTNLTANSEFRGTLIYQT